MNQYCTKFNSNKLITYLNHKASTRQPILSLIFVNYVFVFEIVQQRISHPAWFPEDFSYMTSDSAKIFGFQADNMAGSVFF